MGELLSCPFCGNTPTIEKKIYPEKDGSRMHVASREPCCEVMGMGQTRVFFTRNGAPANPALLDSIRQFMAEAWNEREEP